MNPHPSDLLLERMMFGEPIPDSVLDHVHSCDLCWMRWTALHADEGRALPVRPMSTVGPAPVLPAPSQTPWWIAAVTTVAALAALSLAVRPSSSDQETIISDLNHEIATLRMEIGVMQKAASASHAPSPAGVNQAPREPGRSNPAATGTSGAISASPSDIPPEVLEAAVHETLRQRKEDHFNQAEKKAEPKTLERVGSVIDTMVAGGILTDTEAGEVERLLQNEHNETWAIKRAVNDGDLTGEEGIEDWKMLRQETNDTLLNYLEVDEVKGLRDALDGGTEK